MERVDGSDPERERECEHGVVRELAELTAQLLSRSNSAQEISMLFRRSVCLNEMARRQHGVALGQERAVSGAEAKTGDGDNTTRVARMYVIGSAPLLACTGKNNTSGDGNENCVRFEDDVDTFEEMRGLRHALALENKSERDAEDVVRLLGLTNQLKPDPSGITLCEGSGVPCAALRTDTPEYLEAVRHLKLAREERRRRARRKVSLCKKTCEEALVAHELAENRMLRMIADIEGKKVSVGPAAIYNR